MKISPFPALRPSKNKACEIASPPYDVVSGAEAAALAKGKPDSFLHVIRSEIDLPAGTNPYDDIVYQKARENLDRMLADGALVREDAAAIYIYRQTMGDHSQTAAVACCEIDDYANNVILRHEKTRQDKEDDRMRHILATNANTGQVFLAYREVAAITWLVESECEAEPLYDFTADDGVRHTVWKAVRTDAIAQAFLNVPKAYIADGHHRSAASFRAGMARRAAAGAAADPAAEYNRFMACLFPSTELKILPYNRCVKNLNGFTPDTFLKRVAGVFKVEDATISTPLAPRSCLMYLAGRWRKLSWEIPESADLDVVSQLDASHLQDKLLEPILKIGDPRTDERLVFVGGIRGNEELVRIVDSGRASVAFAMHPTSIDQMMDVADAGQIMPPKSTWFEPKLRSGLLVHTLD